METIFKVGDRVYDIRFGWGTVKHIEEDENSYFPISVLFDNDKFQNNKLYEVEHNNKTYTNLLSFTEYTLQGFSLERPINYDDYIGRWGKFWDTAYENTVIIAKLSSYLLGNGYRSFRCYTYGEDSDMGYTNFEPLTEEQTKVLNLE